MPEMFKVTIYSRAGEALMSTLIAARKVGEARFLAARIAAATAGGWTFEVEG